MTVQRLKKNLQLKRIIRKIYEIGWNRIQSRIYRIAFKLKGTDKLTRQCKANLIIITIEQTGCDHIDIKIPCVLFLGYNNKIADPCPKMSGSTKCYYLTRRRQYEVWHVTSGDGWLLFCWFTLVQLTRKYF